MISKEGILLQPAQKETLFYLLFKKLLFHQGTLTLADQVIYSATSFLTSIMLGRLLDKPQFGLFSLGLTVVLSVTTLQISLILGPYTVYSQGIEGLAQAKYKGSSLIHQLGLSVICCVVLLAVSVIFSFMHGQRGLADVLSSLAFVIGFIMLRDYIRRICFAHLQMTEALFLDTLTAVLLIGGMLAFAHFEALSASRAFWIIGLSCALTAAVWFARAYRTYVFSIPRAIADLRTNLHFGKWLFWSALFYTCSTQIYPWLINVFSSTASVAVFSACRGPTSMMVPFVTGMENFLGPKTASSVVDGGHQELGSFVRKTTLLLVAAMAVFCVIIYFLGDELVQLMYGRKYSGNQALVSVLATSQALSAVAFPISHGLLALRKPDAHFKTSLVVLIITATIGIWLVVYFGPIGAALGLLIGNAGGSAARAILYKRALADTPATGDR